jgi:phosphoglycerate dehydrogenase-like enzyme
VKLVIPSSQASLVLPRIATIAPALEVVQVDAHGQPAGDVADAEMLLRGWFADDDALRTLVGRMPALKWLHTPSAGVDGLLFPELRERGIVVTNSAGAQGPPIAEFVLLALLMHIKRASALLAAHERREWLPNSFMLDELTDKTLLLLGLGGIGTEIARRAHAFDMRVIGSRRTVQPTPGVDEVVGEHEWRAYLPQADFVVVAAPLTDATRGMVDAQAFAAMKPTAYLVNIARGPIIDEGALLEALYRGTIAGALLDAFETEPLPHEHPLWQAPNVTITSHISWSSPKVRERNAAMFLDNLRRYLQGDELYNIVDQAAGY